MVNHAIIRAIRKERNTRLPVSEQRPTQTTPDSEISLAELRDRLDDPDLTIVDVRALPAYNGWRSSGGAPGGHIPGAGRFPSARPAVALPGAWLDSVDGPEVERLLQAKGILQGREIVLYGDRPQDALALKTRLAELGQTAARFSGAGGAGG